jgi:ATP-dependent DNA ligase
MTGERWRRYQSECTLLRIRTTSFLIDGEAVIARDDGMSDFRALRKAARARLTRASHCTRVNLFREH